MKLNHAPPRIAVLTAWRSPVFCCSPRTQAHRPAPSHRLWTAGGGGSRFCLLVHHTDASGEWSYDRTSSIGKLDKALDEAKTRGWTLVNMLDDWKAIYPPAR